MIFSILLVVKEVGADIYDPVVYFPRADIQMHMLSQIDRTTHCPLNGDTEYFDIVATDGRLGAAAWSYTNTVDAAAALRDLVAFDQSSVAVRPLDTDADST